MKVKCFVTGTYYFKKHMLGVVKRGGGFATRSLIMFTSELPVNSTMPFHGLRLTETDDLKDKHKAHRLFKASIHEIIFSELRLCQNLNHENYTYRHISLLLCCCSGFRNS